MKYPPFFRGPVAYVGKSIGEDAARKYAAMVKRRWAEEGHDVKVWIEPAEMRRHSQADLQTIWEIKSDLINGLPRPRPSAG